MTLAIHGTPGHNFVNTGTATTIAANITTTVADTIIIAVIGSFQQLNGSAVRTVTGVAGGGLTWARRAANSGTVSNIFAGQEVWWAYSSAIQTAAAITATFNIAPNQACDIEVFAVSGSPDFVTPWDANVSLPAIANHMNSTTTSLPTVSGTDTSVLALQLEFCTIINNGLTGTTVGSGFTNISPSPITTGTIRSMWGSKNTSSAGAQTYPFVNNQNFWLVVGDALKGDAVATTGTMSSSLTKISQSAAGKETFTGTISTALTKISQAVQGTENVTGTISTALSGVSQDLAGSTSGVVDVTGTVEMDLSGIAQAVLAQEIFSASVETDLSGISQMLSDSEIFVGTITTTLSGISQEVDGNVSALMVGTIVTALTGISQDLVGEEDFTGQITMHLGEAGQLVSTDVQGLEIIEGPIVMDLSGFGQAILGGSLGTPGSGKWYSYRYLDS